MPTNSAGTARRIFQQQRAHCAQAIFAAYGEQLGLGNVEFDTCMKIAAAFSGGIARTGNVCGALTGALMAIGLKYSGAQKADEIAGYLLNEFKSRNGSIICRELINHDLLTDEDIQQAFKKGSFDRCPKYVEDVTIILDKLLLLHLSE